MSISTGAAMIAAERSRQIDAEGWTPEHDQGHRRGELTRAAIAYATNALRQDGNADACGWPWLDEYGRPTGEGCGWKPRDPLRDLVRAGALIAAELDRLLAPAVPLRVEAKAVADAMFEQAFGRRL